MITTTETYKSRKKMLNDFYIDEDVKTMKQLKEVAANYDVSFNALKFQTLAVSNGTYGMNGAVVSAYISNPDIDTQFIFSIKERSTLLFQVVG